MPVRPATPEDADAIAAVGTETWHDTYDDIMGRDTVADLTADWYDPATVRDHFADDAFSAYVYELDGEIVGYAYSRPAGERDDLWRLSAVYVRPDVHAEGIGTALVERVERDARRAHRDRVRLFVLASNREARAFYEARGYKQVDECDTATVEGTREPVYEKCLGE